MTETVRTRYGVLGYGPARGLHREAAVTLPTLQAYAPRGAKSVC